MGYADPLFEVEIRLSQDGPGGRAREAASAALSALERKLDEERERLALWFVVGIGAGILLYFGLETEPPFRAGFVAVAAAAVLFALARGKRVAGEAATLLILSLAVGFLAAEIRVRTVSAPVLVREMGPMGLEGRLISTDSGGSGRVKALLEVTRLDGLPSENWPKRVRVSFRPDATALVPGGVYRMDAVLHPPEGPVAPGAYDFARRAYFERVGAVGYAIKPPEALQEPPSEGWESKIERAREALGERIDARLEGAAGGVAVALVTGLRTDIPKDAENDLRFSGLYHLISISGVHMSAIALGLFVVMRFGLALFPALALRHPIKKWAAGFAILGTFAYLLFTGCSLPTVRSFVMAALVFLAVIADRRALTMRNVALAAALLLIALPESILDPGFQMSFAATTALIALYESWRRDDSVREGFSLQRIAPYFLAIMLSGLIAGLATAPFSAYHFQQGTPLSLFANLLAIPVMDLIVMPASFLIYALAPLNWDGPAIFVVGAGCRLILAIAHLVAGLPGSVLGVKAGPPEALSLIALGGLWLSLWRTRWRWGGLAPGALGLALWGAAPMPDIYIAREAKAVALRDVTGHVGLLSGRGGSFEVETWLRRDGLSSDNLSRRAQGRHCDALGCVAPLQAGGVLAVSDDPGSLVEDCAQARILISTGIVRQNCIGPDLIVDRRILKGGPVIIRFEDGVPVMLPVNNATGKRPWAPAPVPRTQYRRMSPTSRP